MSDQSELEDGPIPSSKNNRQHTAMLRELKKKVLHGKVEITELPEGITPHMLFNSSPSADSSHTLPIDQRVDSVQEALVANGLTITQFIRSTCASEAMSQRLTRDPTYRPTVELMMDIANARAWAKEAATKMLLNEAKNMQSNGALFTAEQRVKNAGSFESGTAATIVEFGPPDGKGVEAIDEALDLEKYLEAVQNAPDIKLEDLILTPDDEEHLRKEFMFEAIKILSEQAGSNFKRFKKCKSDS
ncbi:hypothetical protein RSOL_533240, partial [Rhizoctonia solani AG-3 Rhs1AP]